MEQPDRDTAFIKGGRDIFMESSDVYWWFFFLSVVYTGLLFGQWVTLLNIQVPYTYFANPGAPGDLFSLRYASVEAVTLVFVGTRIFLVMSILSLMAFRKSYGCNLFWITLVLLCAALQAFAFFSLTVQYARHAQDFNRYGLAADPFYCCAPERHANPLNNCVNALPCGDPVPPGFSAADLTPNQPFVALYWVNFALCALDVVWVVWLLIMWNTTVPAFLRGIRNGGSSVAQRKKRDDVDDEEYEYEDDDDGEYEDINAPLLTSAAAAAKQHGHGLRERKK